MRRRFDFNQFTTAQRREIARKGAAAQAAVFERSRSEAAQLGLLGSDLKRRRAVEGLGQEQLAKDVGLSKGTISNLERNRGRIEPDTLARLRRRFGL